MLKGINSLTVVRVCWWGAVRTVTKALWPTSYLTHMLVAPRLSRLSALITSLLSFPSLPAPAAPMSFHLTHFSSPLPRQLRASLSRAAIMPLLGARFCHDRLIDNPCSFPAGQPPLACLMPDPFRVSTGSPLPHSAECHLSVSVPGPARVDEFSKQGTSSSGFLDVCVLYNSSARLGGSAVVTGSRWWKSRAGAAPGLLPCPVSPAAVTATKPHPPAQGPTACHSLSWPPAAALPKFQRLVSPWDAVISGTGVSLRTWGAHEVN